MRVCVIEVFKTFRDSGVQLEGGEWKVSPGFLQSLRVP